MNAAYLSDNNRRKFIKVALLCGAAILLLLFWLNSEAWANVHNVYRQ